MKANERIRLLTATKLYLTEEKTQDDKCYEIRVQLPTEEYVLIDLSDKLPLSIIYKSLKHNGFGYNPDKDPPITSYGKTKVVKILENSKDYRYNDQKTVEYMIDLVKNMENLLDNR